MLQKIGRVAYGHFNFLDFYRDTERRDFQPLEDTNNNEWRGGGVISSSYEDTGAISFATLFCLSHLKR
jgi:hypothetical protein